MTKFYCSENTDKTNDVPSSPRQRRARAQCENKDVVRRDWNLIESETISSKQDVLCKRL